MQVATSLLCVLGVVARLVAVVAAGVVLALGVLRPHLDG